MSPSPDDSVDSRAFRLVAAPEPVIDATGSNQDRWRAARDRWRALAASAARALTAVRIDRAAYLASALVVGAVTLAYAHTWFAGYREALLDPGWQTDDARTVLFALHRFAPGAPLASDPIAREMLEYQPYAYQWLYRAIVPFVGVLSAAKIVQAGLVLIIVGAGAVLAGSRRAGLGVAALFVFLFLRDHFVMDRLGSALPRGFGLPAMALWLAGAFADRPWPRRAAALLASLTYPSALAMILAAEGLLVLRRLGRPGLRTTLRRLGRYAALVAACVALLTPTLLAGSSGGPMHTYEQAAQEPAFGRSGRLKILPLEAPGKAFGTGLLEGFEPFGASPWPTLFGETSAHRHEVSVLVLVVLAALAFARRIPWPRPALAFLIGCLALHALASIFAFRLYSPERYYSYGTRIVAIALALGVVFVAVRRRALLRGTIRNLLAAAVIGVVWLALGDGVKTRQPLSMWMRYEEHESLWAFVKSLPLEARIATHPRDGDDIPLFGERANNGAYETMQPWLTRSWARQKERAEDTLRAFYAVDPATLLGYCRKYSVTHLLVNESRYRKDFVNKSAVFEPITSFARELLAERELGALVLRDPPRQAVVHRHGRFRILDVRELERAWSTSSPSAR